jgi:trk system potassium uptake protein TrkA
VEEIVRLVNQSAFTDDYEFEGGKLSVFGISLKIDSPLINKTVTETSYLNQDQDFKPLALLRNRSTIIVNKDTKLELGDIVYFISKPESIETVTKICGQENHKIKNIMILGGSNIGVLAAQILEKNFNLTLIEKDRKIAERVASHLKKTLVINSDGRDVAALEEENIQEMDAFISVTGDSETNIISSLVDKSHGVKKTIARVENIDYINLSQNIGVDTLINKKVITASNIFKYIRKGEVEAIMSLHGTNAEIIEFNAKVKKIEEENKRNQKKKEKLLKALAPERESILKEAKLIDATVKSKIIEANFKVDKLLKDAVLKVLEKELLKDLYSNMRTTMLARVSC